jgi:hypothetical protein
MNKLIKEMLKLIKSIKINLEAMESMLYYWKATSEKEKVGENYLVSIADNPLNAAIYNDNFSKESLRKTLSAISNREPFAPNSKEEGRFWNNNMWMLEDLGFMDSMLAPIKTLNLDKEVSSIKTDKDIDVFEIVFVPGHLDVYYKKENKLVINFFRVSPSLYDDSVSIDEVPFKEYLVSKIEEIVK